jgi:hypothetical protein
MAPKKKKKANNSIYQSSWIDVVEGKKKPSTVHLDKNSGSFSKLHANPKPTICIPSNTQVS